MRGTGHRADVTRRTPLFLAALIGSSSAFAAAAGCGGATAASPGADASLDTASTHDAAHAAESAPPGPDGSTPLDADAGCGLLCDAGSMAMPSCPSAPPTGGGACSREDEVCEYGSSWWLVCNQVFRCASGQWIVDELPACDEPVDGGPCPATWDAALAAAAAIADAAPGTCPFATCVYPEGFCGCGVGCNSGPGDPHRPLDVSGIFTCLPAKPGCPEPRPLSGAPCDPDAGGCSYGFGCGCGQEVWCTGGLWQATPSPACP